LAGIPPLVGAAAMFMIRCVKTEGKNNERAIQDEKDKPLAAWDPGILKE
jgi:hypothetical protein